MNKRDLLFRQVHPAHIKNGLSSGAFRPTPSDEDKLSVDCSNMTSAEAAFELHKRKTKLNSSGGLEFLDSDGDAKVNCDGHDQWGQDHQRQDVGRLFCERAIYPLVSDDVKQGIDPQECQGIPHKDRADRGPELR